MPKEVHVKVISKQALEVTLVVRKVMKILAFAARSNVAVYFSPHFEFRLNRRT